MSRTRLSIAFVLAFLCAFVLIFSKSMGRGLNFDENVFVASAALWSRAGLMPYRDFHYNHLPTLLFIDGLLFKLSDHLLLIARVFSCICAAVLVAIIFTIALSRFTVARFRHPLRFSLLVAVILMCNSLFTLTTGIAWNHDFPTLLTFLAFLTLDRTQTLASRPLKTGALLPLSGLLLGLATTSRLTFAPAAAAFVLIIVFDRDRPLRLRFALASLWFLGFIIAWIPTFYVAAQAPYNTLWGTFIYPRYNTAFHVGHGAARISILEKIWFFISNLVKLPANGALMIAAAIVVFPFVCHGLLASRAFRGSRLACKPWHAQSVLPCNRPLLGLCLLILFLLIGSYVPSPVFKQYLYAPMPFMVLAWLWTISPDSPIKDAALSRKLLVVVAVISFAFGFFQYLSLPNLFTYAAWVPVRIHERGLHLRQSTGAGPVLTFAPLIPLEGGQTIFPELSTGMYAYRATQGLPADQIARLRIAREAELLAIINAQKPPMLLGVAPDFEAPLIRAAAQLGYATEQIPDAGVILIPPNISAPAPSAATAADKLKEIDPEAQ
jgi:hypothetical protein